MTLDAIEPFRAAWDASNAAALAAVGPLWVVLGDSTAQGIGAPSADRGYVGQLRSLLEARDRRAWRILNASRSGARLRDVVARQLDWLATLHTPPDLVTCAAGANDLAWRPGLAGMLRDLTELLERLPRGAVVATLPRGLSPRRALVANEAIRAAAPARGLLVADVWARTGPPRVGTLAADGFHPSETGYRDWTAAFAETLGLNRGGAPKPVAGEEGVSPGSAPPS